MTRSTFIAATAAFLAAITLSFGTASARPGSGLASLHRNAGLAQASRPAPVPLPRPRPQLPERADDLSQRS
jgi:hypothetical protein